MAGYNPPFTRFVKLSANAKVFYYTNAPCKQDLRDYDTLSQKNHSAPNSSANSADLRSISTERSSQRVKRLSVPRSNS